MNIKEETVLLNTLESKGKSYKVFFHKDILTWERTKSRKDNTKVTVPLADIISVLSKDERASIIGGGGGGGGSFGSSTVLSPTGSCYQVHPSGQPQSPFVTSPTSIRATVDGGGGAFEATQHPAPEWNDDCREFTIYYAKTQGKTKLRDHSITFNAAESKIVRQWVTILNCAINGLNRPKNLLLFINPFGGKRNALAVYEKNGKDLFKIAKIEVLTVISQRANQISDTIWRQALHGFDGIVCCGGDGTFAEVMQGLIYKALDQHENNMNRGGETVITCDDGYIPDIDIPVGIIPAGSTDGVVYCLHGTTDAKTAILNIILGQRSGLDATSVRNEKSDELLRVYSSILSYGYLGDTMRESERLRWMGPKRYDFTGAKNLIKNRGYHVEITYLAENNPNADDNTKCYPNCSKCAKAAANKLNSSDHRSHSTDAVEEWKTIRGKYFMVSATNIRCACSRTPNGVSPTCHLGDGFIDIILIRHSSIFNNLRLLLQISRPNKSIEDLPFVERIRTRKFRFKAIQPISINLVTDSTQTIQPGTPAPDERYTSSFNCDGEIIEDVNVKVKAHCQLIQVFRRQRTAND